MPMTTGKATELITFSRGTLATVTDADGKIKWAPHNLLTHSEQFDGSGWTKSSATIAANAVAAPNGTTTADTITASGANGTALQTFTAEAIPYTFGVWLKRKTGTGNIQIAADSGTYTTVTITSEWALYTVTQTPAAGSKTAGIRIVTSGDAIEAWGAHLYRSDLGGMQANASAFPMYNPSTPKNLLGYSEDFSNAAWSKPGILAFGSGSTINATAAPNGSLSADLLTESTSTGFHSVYQSFTCVSNTPYVFAGYVKPNGRTIVRIAAQATGNIHIVEFTLSGAGSFVTRSGSGTAAITALDNGWYRISTISTATGSGTGYWQIDMCSAANTNSYTGDGTSGIYLWGAQLSDSASLDAYVPNFGAAPSASAYHGPRLDYSSSGSALGLLVEEGRANKITQSNVLNVAAWSTSTSGTGVVPVVTPADAIAPDGTLTAQKVVFDRGAGNSGSDQSVISINVSGYAASTAYTGSVYVKAATAGDVGKQLAWRHVGSAGYGVITLTAAWQRVTRTETSLLTSGTFDLANRGTVSADNVVGAHIWGAQLEVGSGNAATAFATSLIVTKGAEVTRNADVASVGVSQFPYSATEGTLVVAYDMIAPKTGLGYPAVVQLDDGTSNNYIAIRQDGTSDYRRYGIVQNGASIASMLGSTSETPAANSVLKSGLTYRVNDFAFTRETTLGTASSGSIPTVNTMRLGKNELNVFINSHIRQITYLPRRLTNAELQSRTA